MGGLHPVFKVKMRSAIKRLKRSGDNGSPCLRPTFDVKVGPMRLPSLIRAGVLE